MSRRSRANRKVLEIQYLLDHNLQVYVKTREKKNDGLCKTELTAIQKNTINSLTRDTTKKHSVKTLKIITIWFDKQLCI